MDPVKASLRHPIVTLVITALLVAVGINALLTMPRMEDPEITIRVGLVVAAYPGATSEQVEQQVTRKLEEHIFRFAEVRKDKTWSTTRPGIAIVNVELEDHVTDADGFWSTLRHELNVMKATELPDGVRGPIVESDFGDTVAMLVAIHGRRYGYRELHDYADTIQDELRGVRSVARLRTYGDRPEEIWITSSLERLAQYLADPLRAIQALRQRNVVLPSGAVDAGSIRVPLRTTGLFTTEDQIRDVLVDVSPTGQPVRIRDVASVERRYQDPTFVVRYDGEPAILLSIEMQRGENIVSLGEGVAEVFEQLRHRLPPDLEIDIVASQPAVVEARMRALRHEFLLAMGAVILVTVLLLPLRVSVISAVAIPVTLCTSVGVMHALGVPLHQVSIASLIVILGIVVDDAIVIADNYVDLLDRGVSRAEAARKCVHEVFVPVLAATLTIIAAFLPMLILTGSIGEFIEALPITVAVALSVSFLVAVFVTPLLARAFIRTGLRQAGAAGGRAPISGRVLDALQRAYHVTIARLMQRKPLALGIGAASIAVGAVLFVVMPEQFFPAAERNQFVVDVWMPPGTRIEATDEAVRRIEAELETIGDVEHYASFVGQSAPRFYYNVTPQQPDGAYAQVLVNTRSVDGTPALVAALNDRLARVVPEALVVARELQQGQPQEAPVEVRITGPGIARLQGLGRRVEDVVRAVPFSRLVSNDWFGQTPLVEVDVDPELANRLGLGDATVAGTLFGGFSGLPVGTFWEGSRPVTLLLRLDADHRASFDAVRDTYVTSRVTGKSVPVRSIATLNAAWQPSRIVHRNGLRTLTVRAFPDPDHYASELLAAIEPGLRGLELPDGYRISYGGERENRDETFPQMVRTLAISVLAIFIVLLLQFRGVSEPLIVMSSIPLALLGAAVGLIVTRNPFGFTAFMGLISLCGVVVRNAIILIDHAGERRRAGVPLERAAIEAGERRLRPIFLTTMAAAFGVTPMILSGSSLWSPLASALAVGLIFSMFFTLIVVPVLFVVVRKSIPVKEAATAVVMLALLAGAAPARAETGMETRPRVHRSTVEEAVQLALDNNQGLRAADARVIEMRGALRSARADFFPRLSNETMLFRLAEPQSITVPAGSFGVFPGIGPFPPIDAAIVQGAQSLLLSSTTLGQPVTQLFKVREAVRVADADLAMADYERRKARDEVALAVRSLFYGLIAARAERDAAAAAVIAAEAKLRDSRQAVASGSVLEVAAIGSRAALLQARQTLATAEDRIDDLAADLNAATGLPAGTVWEPVETVAAPVLIATGGIALEPVLAANPEIAAGRATVEKARHALAAARYEFVPDVSAFVQHTHQDGVPFIAENNWSYGVRVSWPIVDWGKRRGLIEQRRAQVEQAEANLRRIEDRLAADLAKAQRKVERSRSMVEVAEQAVLLRREAERIATDQLRAGVVSEAAHGEAVAAARKAEGDAIAARMAYEIAQAELARLVGETAAATQPVQAQ